MLRSLVGSEMCIRDRLYIISIAALYIGLIGLFFFHWVARPLVGLCIALFFINLATGGLVVYTPILASISWLGSVALILAFGMSLFSPPVLVKFRQSFRGFVNAGI